VPSAPLELPCTRKSSLLSLLEEYPYGYFRAPLRAISIPCAGRYKGTSSHGRLLPTTAPRDDKAEDRSSLFPRADVAIYWRCSQRPDRLPGSGDTKPRENGSAGQRTKRTGAGASVAQEPGPGRTVRHACRGQSAIDVSGRLLGRFETEFRSPKVRGDKGGRRAGSQRRKDVPHRLGPGTLAKAQPS
jgi:hypothetical protein